MTVFVVNFDIFTTDTAFWLGLGADTAPSLGLQQILQLAWFATAESV